MQKHINFFKVFFGLVFWLGLAMPSTAQDIVQTIAKDGVPDGWLIKTKSSSYQLILEKSGQVKFGFYGSNAQADFAKRNAEWTARFDEVPVRGGYANKTPALEVVFNDNVRDADLQYVNGEVITFEGRPTLKITQKDKLYPLQVISYIKVFSEFDVLEKWIEVKNTAKKGNILVENLKSGSIVLPKNEYTLTQLAGTDVNEFQVFKSHLSPGLKVIENKMFKANAVAPWFCITPLNDGDSNYKPAWFGAIHYSGNWKLEFDKTFAGPLQVLGGINFWDTTWTLKPGETLSTPKFTVGYSDNGAEGATQNLTAYIANDVLPKEHRNQLRPVIYNSWEAQYYNVNEKQQLELIEVAKSLGVELFTIDDGWFRGRTDGRSQSGLGNWDIDKNKFPNGLTPVINRVHELGMKFGLWIEPENVNPNSDVAMKHPEWIFQYPNKPGNVKRKILNLAHEGAYNYLLETFTTLFKNNKIDFIKWDQNNGLSEPGWQDAPIGIQREARIRHIDNVYRLVDELRKRFPEIMFESCAGGGGRVDLGMLSRMDIAWPSDNTDPIDRLMIQYGYLNYLPANTMVSWVTSTTRHQPVSLSYRFDVSMSGVLGMGNDIRKWTAAEREIAKGKISLYKNIRPIVQQGILYKLVSPFETSRCALQYNSKDKDSTVLFCYNLAEYLKESKFDERSSNVLRFKGLKPNAKYRLKEATDAGQGTIYTAEFLSEIGIAWPVNKPFESKILTLNRIK